MKIKSRTKIICDICGIEISWDRRTYIKVTEYTPYLCGKYEKDKWDICRDCAEEMKDYIRQKVRDKE